MSKNILFFVIVLFLGTAVAQVIPNLPIPLGAGTAEVWNNAIYYFGGSNNWSGSIVYPRIYKFTGTTWTYHDSIPDNNLWDVESVLVGDWVYLISGWPSGASYLRKYSMTGGNWIYLTSSPNTTQDWGIAAEHLNNIIYLFNSYGEVYAYDIAGDTWTPKTFNSATGSWDLSSILYQDDIYIIGFSDSTFYKYTPALDQWTDLAKSPYHVGACAMGIINDSIYCVGGNTGGGTIAQYKSTIVYNITNNTWSIDSLRLSSKRHWMATAEYAGGLYVLGGIDSLSYAVDIVEEIVPQGTSNIFSSTETPEGFILKQNYPNPFNPSTTIEFSIPETEYVTLKIFNITGQEVAFPVTDRLTAGNYKYVWDAINMASGIYYYKIETAQYSQTRKLILMK